MDACEVTDAHRRLAATNESAVSLEKMGYTWEQTEAEVRIRLPVCGVSAEDVDSSFTEHGCTMQATVCGRRHVFEVQRTFAPVAPLQCSARVARSREHVIVTLRKREAGVEWPHLRP